MSESTNNAGAPSVGSEESFKSKFLKYTKLVGDVVAVGAVVVGIVAVTTYGVMKVLHSDCSVDIG